MLTLKFLYNVICFVWVVIHMCIINISYPVYEGPLTKSEYTITNTQLYTNRLKQKRIQKNYKIILFNVKTFLGMRLSIILYNSKIEANFPRKTIQELLLLSAKNIHFIFNGDACIQWDDVAIGPLLGPL